MKTNTHKIMKTHKLTFSISLGLLASIFLFVSCVDFKPHDDHPPQNDDPPKQIISVAQAKTMYDSYTERRVRPIKQYEHVVDSTKEFFPTRYVEYDLETVKQYIAFIESEAKLANAKVGKLRFYNANYPNADAFPSGEVVKYRRQNSFVVVPTTAIDGKQQGFITRTTSDGGRVIVPLKELMKDQVQTQERPRKGGATQADQVSGVFSNPKFLFINPVLYTTAQEVGEDVSLLLNDGHVIPPPNQETDFDD